MALSAANFVAGVTRQQAVDTLLGMLKELGFRATSWQEGSVQRSLLTGAAWLYSGATQVTKNIFLGGYPTTAGLVGEAWLDLLLEGFYETTRLPAVTTKGLVRLTADGTTGSVPWGVNELKMSDDPLGNGRVFHVTGAGAINSFDVLDVEFEAVVPGRASNIASTVAGTDVYLLTPIPGVTAQIISDPVSGTWITRAGDDRETNARYLTRALARWSTLCYGSAHDGLAYKKWALEADSTVTDVVVLQGVTPANVRVICRTIAGGIDAGQIAAISAYIADGRRPINDVVSVESANPVAFQVALSPVIARGRVTAGQIQAALDVYFSTLPIGGKLVYPAISGAVLFEDMVELVLGLDGVFRSGFTAPTTDTTLGSTDIAIPSYTITPIEVGSGGV